MIQDASQSNKHNESPTSEPAPPSQAAPIT